jgi:hypothetical protein
MAFREDGFVSCERNRVLRRDGAENLIKHQLKINPERK